MDTKEILTNKSFCTLPWTGFELEPNGTVKNCIISTEKLGNIEQQDIESVLLGAKNTALKEKMIANQLPNNCSGCYLQEKGRKNLSSISSRLYYTKELAPYINKNLYDSAENFSDNSAELFERQRSNFVQRNFQKQNCRDSLKLNFGNFP